MTLKYGIIPSVAVAALLSTVAISQAADLDPVVQEADPFEYYVSIFGGASFPKVYDFQTVDQVDSLTTWIGLDTGFIGGAAIGTEIYENLRAELEFSYERNSVDRVRIGGVDLADPDARVQAYSGFANLWYDIDALSYGKFTPYIGGGIGVSYIDAEDVDGFSFAAQSGVGFNFAATDSIDIGVGYRFRINTSSDLDDGGVTFEDYHSRSHNVIGSLTFKF